MSRPDSTPAASLKTSIGDCRARVGTRRLFAVACGLVLCAPVGGCGGSALDLAPPAPDVPFKPEQTTVVDGRSETTKPPDRTASGARDFGLPPTPSLPFERAEPTTNPTRVYALADLIDLAQTNNPETRAAWDQARQAALTVGVARSLYLPTITATVVGGKQSSSSSNSITTPLTGQPNQSDITGTVSTVALQWLIFDFGGRDAITRAAKFTTLASDIAFNGEHQKIIYDVSRKFYDYTSARQTASIAVKSRTESAELFNSARQRYAQGVGTTIEVAQARQQLAQADLDVVKAQGSERDGYHSLIAAVGITPVTTLRIEDVSHRALPPALSKPVEGFIADAISRRPDIQASYAAAQASREGIAQARAEFLPKVFVTASGSSVSGNLGLTSLPDISSLTGGTSSSGASGTTLDRSNATFLGGVSVPLFDGGLRDARLRSAQARTDQADASVVRLQQNAASEIVSAEDALRTSLASYRAASVLVDAAATARDAAFSAYRSGLGPITSAIEAERSVLSARLAQEQAHGSALIAAATLAFATGRLSSSDVVSLSLPHGPF